MMNRLFKYILSATLAFTLISCDDFLDIQPTGKVIPQTATEFREFVTNAYSIVPSDRGKSTFRSDEFIMDAALSKEDLNSYKDIWTWNDDSPSESTSSFDWRSYYQIMFSANYTIDSKDKITNGTPAVINQLVGECYMLRAYMHFLLVNLYGEPYTACDPATTKAIPLKMNTDVDKVLSRNTVGDVYEQILRDIDEAEKLINVESWETGLTYRFNTVSVDALRSRVYLYMGRWKEAYNASKKVLEKRSELEDFSKYLPNDFRSVESIVSLERNLTAQFQKAGKVNKTFYNLYASGDLRRSKYYKLLTASNIQALKGGDDNYRCTFRTGEIYLNAAEAALESDEIGIAEAKTILLSFMKTRYNASSFTAKEALINNMAIDDLRAELYNERARELAFEGHRWFDLRRTTRQELQKIYSGETFILQQNDKRYTLRIPSEAVAANPELAN
ncbi:MAG: RagB/SusD family nutrient uptake outer membrane protein [Muribaculaceae bacterium]|nr:RagB/SusD family nutrient uptake outer membrane protein [Muribaculaceae bacterium]